MQIPLKITFNNMEPSPAVEAAIREKADKLEQFADAITSCRVIVEAPHQHHHKGNLYRIKVDVTLPGKEIVTNRNPSQHHAHEDIYVAIRDAFNAERRQLEDYLRKRRGKVKQHEAEPHGKIVQLVPYEDYGVIQTSDGREIYFHRNSVIEQDFDKLEIGDNVHFSEEMGDNGPQATTVHVEGKHHVV